MAFKPISTKNIPNATKADTTAATAKTNMQFGGQREALDAAMRQLKGDTKQQTSVQKELGGIHDKRIGEISQLLNQQLKQNTGRVESTYAGAQGAIEGAYDKARQHAEGASQSVQDTLRESMERLGLTAGAPDTLGKLQQQQTDQRGMNAIAGAGAVGNIANLGADMVALFTKSENDSLQEWAGKRDEFAKRIQNAILGINQEYNQQRNNLLQQISSLEGTRGNAFVVSLMDTINERLERERQAKMDALQAEIQRGQLAVARGHLGVAQGNLSLSREKMQHDLAAARAAQNTNDPLARLRAQVEEKKLLAELNGTGGSGQQHKGVQGVQGYVQEQGLNPALTNQFRDLQLEAHRLANGNTIAAEQILQEKISSIGDPRLRRHVQNMADVYNSKYATYAGSN